MSIQADAQVVTAEDSRRLFTPGQVFWGTVLGTPLAGCLMLAMNASVWRQRWAGVLLVVAGFVATVVIGISAFFLPVWARSYAIPALYSLSLYLGARTWQGARVAEALANGGRRRSHVVVFLLGLACLFALLLLIVVTAVVLEIVAPGLLPDA